MIAHQPDTTPEAETTTVAPDDVSGALSHLEVYMASPEFRSLGDSFDDTSPLMNDEPLFGADFSEEPLFGAIDGTSPYLTSPMFDEFGTSPMDTPFSDFLATPAVPSHDDFDFDDSPRIDGDLFGGAFDDFSAAATVEKEQMWTMSGTPVLESAGTVFPTATAHGPVIPPAPQRASVTGTRKHLTPDSLIPLDAPTQKRTYATPSATSRKAVPAAIVKKRAHSAAFPDADDEELEALSPTASEAEIIEHKRRQNTLAARKSRKRKLEHQRGLEDAVDGLRSEVAVWRERALMAQEMLRAKGITFSFE